LQATAPKHVYNQKVMMKISNLSEYIEIPLGLPPDSKIFV